MTLLYHKLNLYFITYIRETSQSTPRPEGVNIATTHLNLVLCLFTVRCVLERYSRQVKMECWRKFSTFAVAILPLSGGTERWCSNDETVLVP